MEFKTQIAKLISQQTNLESKEIEQLIETPPSQELGDFSLPCFSLAKTLKKNPVNIAEDLAKTIKPNKVIESVQTRGPYLNFYINKQELVKQILESIEDKTKKPTNKNKTIVIDMSSPNIAKPFGIGHLRSTIIGNSIAEICKALNYKVIKINYLGDWGTQFGKMILGYKKFGSESKLKQDPIKHLLELYVKANDEKYEQEARDKFKKLEQGDKQSLALWKKFRDLSLKEFNEIYKLLNVKFDVISGESKYNNQLNKVVKELKSKNLLQLSQDAQIIDLEKYGLGIALIQKQDGTSLYVTRDIAAAKARYNKYKFHKMFYEVGAEQKLHFKQLFKILELLDCKWSKDMTHIDHGLYLGKDNKRLATRKGKTIFMRDVWNEVYEKVEKNLKSRNKQTKLSEKELKHRAEIITRASIFYADLSSHRSKNIVFDIDKMTDFEGNTGPYLLYSYARASSILKKSKKQPKLLIPKVAETKTLELIKKLAKLQSTIEKTYELLSPNLIANYAFELATIFNEFYHNTQVIDNKDEQFLLKVIHAFRQTLKNSLSLLGIDVLEEM